MRTRASSRCGRQPPTSRSWTPARSCSVRDEGSVGLIAADARIPALTEALTAAGLTYLGPGEETTAQTRLTLVPASLAKGLEYDYVVLDEPQAVVDGEPDERTGLRRLYVALTRAVSGLTVTHAAPLPQQLGLVGRALCRPLRVQGLPPLPYGRRRHRPVPSAGPGGSPPMWKASIRAALNRGT